MKVLYAAGMMRWIGAGFLLFAVGCTTLEATVVSPATQAPTTTVSTTTSIPTTTTTTVLPEGPPTTSTVPTTTSEQTERTGRPKPTGFGAPDPEMVMKEDQAFLYATNVLMNNGFFNVPVWSSSDLTQWEFVGDALPTLGVWAEIGYTWAPGVLETDTGWVLYYTARVAGTTENSALPAGEQCIGVAVADDPWGPFVDERDKPLVCQHELGGSIDPSPFVDAGGTSWLVWKSDGNAPHASTGVQLFVQELSLDGTALVGASVVVLDAVTVGEEIIENPEIVRAANGSLWLVFSAGWWADDTYRVGLARCESPVGPCELFDRQVGTVGPLVGPGGVSVVDTGEESLVVFHTWVGGTAETGGTRQTVVTTVDEVWAYTQAN